MADVVRMLEEFVQPVQIVNPGEPAAVDARADLWQAAAGDLENFAADGTLLADWVGVFPPDTLLKPLAEVFDVENDRLFWVAGLPERRRSMLTGLADHVEAKLKTAYRVYASVDVLRDADTADRNDLGDEIETGGPHLAGVDAAITETTQKVPTTDGDLRTAHVLVGWMAAGTDVRRGDRIRVPAGAPDGVIYGVEAVTQPLRTGLLDMRLDLTRTT